jgi:branched-chain amino acid transport system ATP-binding protein
LRNVDVHYGSVQALFGVSLLVGPGEVVAVLGGNGSGKSTVIRSVLGLVQATAGEVHLWGERADGLATHSIIEQGVGSVPEGRRVFVNMTVRENLLMGAYVRRNVAGGSLAGDIDEILGLFPHLAGRMKQTAGTLSGGEQQMLAMARAWMRRPRFLCIDEPSMGLSPLYVERVYEVLEAFARQGVPILLVEQNANRALEISHRAYVLSAGHIVLEGLSSDLINDPGIRRAYLGAGA